MREELIKVLTQLGLNEKEARVYLSCIEKGTSVVSEIAQKAKINRITTYDILEKLKTRGLVSFFTKEKTKYFTGTNPEVVLETYEKRTNELRLSLPRLKQLAGETVYPRIRYFEGLEGIKNIYADTFKSKTEILNFANTEEIRKHWPLYDKEYVAKRAKKGIFLKGIAIEDAAGKKLVKQDSKYNREIRLVPTELYNFSTETNIYDDKISIISFKDEVIGMIIESAGIANSQRAVFNMCWEFAKTFQKNEKRKNPGIKDKMLKPLSESEVTQTYTDNEEELSRLRKKNLSLF